jgi:molybdopterin-binding protein
MLLLAGTTHTLASDSLDETTGANSMELSARNQLRGTVTNIKAGAVMAEITVQVDPADVTAAITDSSRDRLGLKVGDNVSVIIKATEVIIAKQ